MGVGTVTSQRDDAGEVIVHSLECLGRANPFAAGCVSCYSSDSVVACCQVTALRSVHVNVQVSPGTQLVHLPGPFCTCVLAKVRRNKSKKNVFELRWESALQFLEQMSLKDMSCSATTSAMNACAKAARWEASLWLLAETHERKVLDRFCFNAAMNACEKSSRRLQSWKTPQLLVLCYCLILDYINKYMMNKKTKHIYGPVPRPPTPPGTPPAHPTLPQGGKGH